jgi:hypothetical protein
MRRYYTHDPLLSVASVRYRSVCQRRKPKNDTRPAIAGNTINGSTHQPATSGFPGIDSDSDAIAIFRERIQEALMSVDYENANLTVNSV